MEAANQSFKRSACIFTQPDTVPSYWLTRFMILRLLGIIYAVAFLVAVNQLVPLIGANGLLPLDVYFKEVVETFGSPAAGFAKLPSVFWFWHSDAALLTVSWIGFIVSLVVVAGYANGPLMGVLWFLYMSIVHAGQDWYSYGWEIQLTETGFLAMFLCPLIDMRPFPRRPPPMTIIVLFRWLIFRIMMGSGMIKIRGDKSWLNGTALYYRPLKPVVLFPAAYLAEDRRLVQFSRRTCRAMAGVLAAVGKTYCGRHYHPIPVLHHPQRQPFFFKLANYHPCTGLFRRWLLGEDFTERACSQSGNSCIKQ
jgi:hypothetical protein